MQSPACEFGLLRIEIDFVARSQNWAAEIKKWLGRDRLRVFVADGKNEVQRFASTKHFQVLIIGYEKVRDSLLFLSFSLDKADATQFRTVIDVVKAAQPPIGLIICDEGEPNFSFSRRQEMETD